MRSTNNARRVEGMALSFELYLVRPPITRRPWPSFGGAPEVRGSRICVAKTRFTSVDAYIASKPKETRTALDRVRKAIRKAVPQAEEDLSYQIPVCRLNGVPVLYFAGW